MFIAAALLTACPRDSGDSSSDLPRLEGQVQVVPSDGLPAEVVVQDANNNLDVLEVDGEVFLAWRTAPTHFASSDATLYVVRSSDEESWTFETSINLDTDLREPRLVYLKQPRRLFLYFAVLGDDPMAFEPQGTMYSYREHDGTWSEPEWLFEDTFIPWRVKTVGNQPELIGYTGGGEVYDPGEDLPEIEIRMLTTHDGMQWEPLVEDQPVVHTGGASEADYAYQDGGDLLVVARNEAGDELGFGSLICTADHRSIGSWECTHDRKRYDSPLLFKRAGRFWLIARRNLTDSGDYDLEMHDLSHEDQSLQYEAAYWATPKRCSLWQVFPDEKVVLHVLDLPSRGDTCFPSAMDLGDGHYAVYNYSNDPDGSDLSWVEGQLQPTNIYRHELYVP